MCGFPSVSSYRHSHTAFQRHLNDVAVLKFLFGDRNVVDSGSVRAVIVFQNIGVAAFDERAVISADGRVHNADVTFFDSSDGMKVLIQLKGFSSQLFRQNCKLWKTAHIRLPVFDMVQN